MGDLSTEPADQANAEPDSGSNQPAEPAAPTSSAAPAAPAAEPAEPAPAGPQRLPDDHPLVTALAAQKTKTSALQAEVDKIPATVASSLREHLIRVHDIDEATASTLITGTTAQSVLDQVAAVTGLAGRKATAPKLGTTTSSPQSETAAFASALFGGNDS